MKLSFDAEFVAELTELVRALTTLVLVMSLY